MPPSETVVDKAAPSPKRQKVVDDISPKAHNKPPGFAECLTLLATSPSSSSSSVQPPSSIADCIPATIISDGKVRNDLKKLLSLFSKHNFRTSVVKSPRAALSIYKDSCTLTDNDDASIHDGKNFLLSMVGMHPLQNEIESYYATHVKDVYSLLLFTNRLRRVSTSSSLPDEVATLISKAELSVASICDDAEPVTACSHLTPNVAQLVAEIVSVYSTLDHRVRKEQLEREYDRIITHNATFANARLQLFLEAHSLDIKEVYFKRSAHEAKYERITIYVYDPDIDLLKPPRLTFLPCLSLALKAGPAAIVKDMVQHFWKSLLKRGYFVTKGIEENVVGELEKFFLSGVCRDVNLPLLLNAHFDPQYPLSFYLYGKAGSGKSSFVRQFSPALNETISHHVDPGVLVRFVKQNLNKHQKDLALEFELRPNNNDLSVMSLIQGRRMTLTQTKPGLVVVGLEEIASHSEDGDPNQLETCQLISQRFGGRKGSFNEKETKAPRNSAKRGISGDASLITLFTSNYPLETLCQSALQRLHMFQNIKAVVITPVDQSDRIKFAKTYLTQCLTSSKTKITDLNLDIPVGSGDTRPLVRELRMLSFFISALSKQDTANDDANCVQISHNDNTNVISVTIGSSQPLHLQRDDFNNLHPVPSRVFDSRTTAIVSQLENNPLFQKHIASLSHILDYYFARALAPAVIVSSDPALISTLCSTLAAQPKIHSLSAPVDPSTYKIMKSLYDPENTPNLRDDIISKGRGANVVVEICCDTVDSQLCIREIIEDTPSMTAFSSEKSALGKEGLFFGVLVKPEELTKEVLSRASLVL